MRVKCEYNSGKNIPLEHRCLGETNNTDYSFLEIGKEYSVYALLFFQDRIDYLICPGEKAERPVWVPADLCCLTNNKMSSLWSICVTYSNRDYKVLDSSFKIKAIIGYKELVSSFEHYVGIIERDERHLKQFLNVKRDIDNEGLLF